MENIKLKQINKEESDKNHNNNLALLVIELSVNPTAEWTKAFNQTAAHTKTKSYNLAICNDNSIRVKYLKTKNIDEVFNQIETLVNQVNQEKDDFDSWIDKKNEELTSN